jgi:hypothetical protein
MTDDNTNAQDHQQQPEPQPDIKQLDKLVGTWTVSGGAEGTVSYE